MTFLTTVRQRIHAVAAVAAISAGALMLTACSSSPTSAGASNSSGGAKSSGHNYKIVFMPKSLGNKYFQASDQGGSDAIKQFGGTYSEAGATDASPTAQAPFIQTAIQQRAGAIVLAANDPQAVCSDLKAAQAAGVKVVTFDSDTNCRDLFINQVTVAAVAKGLVDLMAKHLNGTGKIGIESGGPNATNLNAWVAAIRKDMATQYPKIQIVSEVYGNDVDQDSYNAAKGLIQAHPDLNGIIAPDSVASKEAAHFLSDSPQYKGKVWLTGLGLPSELRPYVHSGVVEKFGVWDVNALGYLAAYGAKALIDGTITGKQGDTFTAGKLGKYTVGAKGEVDLGPLLVIDKSNVDKYNF
jgi:rhamnose transport system substrate-binding protein